jgi:hypothetical protein
MNDGLYLIQVNNYNGSFSTIIRVAEGFYKDIKFMNPTGIYKTCTKMTTFPEPISTIKFLYPTAKITKIGSLGCLLYD